MLAIRMQRTGRRGHAQFRMVVQDSRLNPSSGRVVAYLGSYDPHAKTAKLDGEKISKYLGNGAQPSDRAVRILQTEGIKMPAWVKTAQPKKRTVRNPVKRRSTAPKDETPAKSEAPAAEAPEQEQPVEQAPTAAEETAEPTAENSSDKSA
jgi:small subunit ribosomal protein S16